ncbi:30S ribosomal protein S6--L-glutamate ligase [Candidatus Bathyarchaeota archaeon]|nr:MAG: 30S ribosomal protein S6--L-glutamate ligase [Candidatus Bathyarchaeota archaeon]
MKVGILTRNENSWSSIQLRKALTRRNIQHYCFSFPQLIARIGYKPHVSARNVKALEKLDALIVRPIGRGSLEEIIFRMNMLHKLQRLGLYIVNPPKSIEYCADKYSLLTVLEENEVPVPRTVVTENVDEALRAFKELGGDVVVKPIFGSRGVGSARVTDSEVATRVFRAVRFSHGVIYIQEFIPHGFSDVRAFVIGNRVVAAMRRIARSWKTNVSQGAKPLPIKLDEKIEKIAVKSAGLIECKVAGVDILEGPKGCFVVEVNSQPGWRGLQSVTKVNIAEKIVDFILSELKK